MNIGALLLATAVAAGLGASDWQNTLDRVAPAVVELRVSVPRPFDGGSAGYQTATGFVVDAEQGLILTNRHVVTPGPVVAEAVFLDNEEVEVHAVYRDPVHDFGVFRFDPDDVQFMDVTELELAPERARVGTDIRVIGNDAGEKLSILAGTLARLDRDAPRYGPQGYNDFNTFYYQAASGTSGGSSGSPVIDVDGKVVALNAGGKRLAASSFYLPLDRVVRALEFIRDGNAVPRGTLQATLAHRSFDEIRRLGLRSETEAAVRENFPESNGMIVVDQIVPGGPADGLLEPGDVVVRIDGEPVATFLPIEDRLDQRVGETVLLDVERGGQAVEVNIGVGDLHAISPASYLEVGGGVLAPLSYHAARNRGVPVEGVSVSAPGYMFYHAGVPKGAVITHIDAEPVSTLDDVERVLAAIPDGKKVTLRYARPRKPRSPLVTVAEVDRRWFDVRRCHRDDSDGSWPCRAAAEPPAPTPLEPVTTELEVEGPWALEELAPSLALVEFRVPFRLDGVHYDRFAGTGLVVDADRGLVVVDRETVPIALGDLTITFGGSVQIPAEVAYLHPEHNFAVVRYDPRLLGDTPVESATLLDTELLPGDSVWVVGISPSQRLVARNTRVDRREPLVLPTTRPPRFRDQNIELIAVVDSPATVGGVLSDGWGRVQGLWTSFAPSVGQEAEPFFGGIPIGHVIPVVEALAEGSPVDWRSLGVEFQSLTVADARHRGLTEAAAREIESRPDHEKRVFAVYRIAEGSPANGLLREGDLLLSVEGRTVTGFDELEQAAQAEAVTLGVLRDGKEKKLSVPTERLGGVGTERALRWAGALLQEPHRALQVQWGFPKEGVYVARYWFGSPADRYGLRASRRILAVDGKPTPDLDHFLAAVENKPDRGAVRIKSQGLDGKVEVTTLKLDLEFWPTYEFERGPEGWMREPIRASSPSEVGEPALD